MKEDKFLSKIQEYYNGSIEILEYENTKDSSIIKCNCKVHGVFFASVHNLVHHKTGCPLCRVENTRSPYRNSEQLVYKLKSIYGDTFIYDKVNSKENEITLICPIHGEFKVTSNYALSKKLLCPMCRYEQNRQHHSSIKKQRGNKVRKTINKKREDFPIPYSKWNNMFIRCYNKKYKEKTPTYEGCEVCEEWRSFDNFLKWFNDPKNGYREGYHLDKDLLVHGNKIYSPDTCCFIPQHVNAMMTRGQRIRGKVKSIGVTLRNGKYVARCNFGHKEAKLIGCFDNEQDAFYAYKRAKEGYIKSLAEDLFTKGEITEKVYIALLNFKVKQYD